MNNPVKAKKVEKNYDYRCSNCDALVRKNDEFCWKCGAEFTETISLDKSDVRDKQTNHHNSNILDKSEYQGTIKNFRYAEIWKRLSAVTIDSTLIIIVLHFLEPFIYGYSLGFFGGGENQTNSMGFIIGLVGNWIYWAAMESSPKQATLGKMVHSIIVTDLEGNRISFGKASGRYFGKIVSLLILGIGFVMAGFTDKKQALHDIMAGCIVINK